MGNWFAVPIMIKIDPFTKESNFRLNAYNREQYDPACIHTIKSQFGDFDGMIIHVQLMTASINPNDQILIEKILKHYKNNQYHLITDKIDYFTFYKGKLPLLSICQDLPTNLGRVYEYMVDLNNFK